MKTDPKKQKSEQPKPISSGETPKSGVKQNIASLLQPTKIELSKSKIFGLYTICSIVALGLLFSVIYHYYLAHQGKNIYPFNTFLFKPIDRYKDFYNIYTASAELNPYSYYFSNYFPFAFFVMHLFTLITAQNSFILFIGSFMAFLIYHFYRNVLLDKIPQRAIATIILSCMTYPVIFVIDRGNIEVWLLMSLVLFIYFYSKGKDIISIIFLSMAIAFKAYPILFCLIFLIDRKFLLIVYTGLITAFMTLFSAGMLEGGVADSFSGLATIFANGKSVLYGGTQALQHSTSLFVPLKLFYYSRLIQMSNPPLLYEDIFNKYYLFVSVFIFVVTAFILVRYKLTLWKKTGLIVMLFVLLPQISYDYKLLDMLIPLALFIRSEEESPLNSVYAIIFGLLMIPKDYILIADDLSINSVINPSLILLMMGLIIVEAVKSKQTLKLTISGK